MDRKKISDFSLLGTLSYTYAVFSVIKIFFKDDSRL